MITAETSVAASRGQRRVGRGFVVDPDVEAALRGHGVHLGQWGRGRRQQVGDGHRDAGRVGVLHEIEEAEVVVGGTLGEIPGRARCRHGGLRMRPVPGPVPRHEAVRHDGAVGLDHGRELGRRETGNGLGVHRDAGKTVKGDGPIGIRVDGRQLADPATLLESQEGGGLSTWIEQREARVEECRRRALGEVARVAAPGVRPVGVFLGVGAAVAVGITIRATWTGADRGVEPVGVLPTCRQAIAVAVGWWQGQDMDEDVGRPVRVGDHEVRRLGLEDHGAAVRAEGRTARDTRDLRACGGHAHARRECRDAVVHEDILDPIGVASHHRGRA